VWNGTGWNIQIVDTTGEPRYAVGASSSLTLDSDDKPHISYIDHYRINLLKYAFLNGSSWEIHVLSEPVHGGYSTSMVLDSNDKVHIAHGDYTSHILSYVFIDPAALPSPVPAPDPVPPTPPSPFTTSASPAGTVKILDSLGNVGTYSSVALDSEGNPHISYCEGNNFLKYAYCDGTTWHVETVDYDGWPGLYSSIAIDQNDNPCISYWDSWDRELRYASWNGLAWDIQVVDSKGGSFTSLAIDAEGNPHISYFAGVESELKYASWNGSSWRIQTVDSEGRVGECTSLALDSDGNPHISYYDIQQGNLKYASCASSGWHIQIVEWKGNVGWSTSLKIDSNDKPHISYLDGSNEVMKYAVLNNYGWDIQVVDSVGTANYQTWRNSTSLALDSNEYPGISYFDGENGILKYALWNGSSWLIQIVDSTFDVGWFSSLALDSDNRAHISYYDASNRELRYICSPNATGFSTQSTPGPSPIFYQEKMMSFLSDVVGVDLTKYIVTSRTLPQSSYLGVPLDSAEIILSSSQSYMQVIFNFLNGTVQSVSLLDNTGVPQMKKNYGTPLGMAKDFMSNYHAFTGDSFYGTLRSMLDGVSGEEECSQTVGNVKFDLFIDDTGSYVTLGWTYTYNGIGAIPKGVFLSFQNGFLKTFIDNWDLYKIGSTVVNLSEEEAKSIAVTASQKYGHELSGAVNATLFFCSANYGDNPRGQDSLTFYLAWRVEVEYAELSDYVTGVIVDIWADTKDIIRVRKAKIMITDGPTAEPSPSPDPTPIPTAPEFTPWIVLPLLMIATMAGGLIHRRKNANGGEA
jgi:hypothetical protein